jgi:hypothetical protein
MGEKSNGQIFVESFVRAIAWAVVFSAAFVLTMGLTTRMMKQEIKEMIQYASTEALGTSLEALTSREVFPLLKQNVKEAIEYTVIKVDNRLVAPYHPRVAKK